MTQRELCTAFEALGADVTYVAADRVEGDRVVTHRGVDVRVAGRMGTGATRRIMEGDSVDPAALVAEMTAEIRSRDRAARAAIRREKAIT